MPAPFASLRRGPRERLAAWLFTGPLGHLWSVLVDLLLFALRRLAGRSDPSSADN